MERSSCAHGMQHSWSKQKKLVSFARLQKTQSITLKLLNCKCFLSEMSTTLQYTMLFASAIFCLYIPLVPISILYAKIDQYQFLIQFMINEDIAVFKIWGFYSAAQTCRVIFVFLNCYQISRTISLSFLIGFPYFDRLSCITSSLTKLIVRQNSVPIMDYKNNRLKILSLIRSLQQIQVIARTTRFLNQGCTAGAMATVAAIFSPGKYGLIKPCMISVSLCACVCVFMCVCKHWLVD